MKVNSDVLKNFIERISCGGKIEEVVLSFGEEGVYSKAMDPASIVMVEAKLKKEAFGNYQAWGDVGLAGISKFIHILNRFEKEIEVLKEGNVIKLLGNREADIILPETEFIKEVRTFPEIPFEIETTIDTSVFKEAESNANVLKTRKYKVFTEKNVLTIETGDDDKIREKKTLAQEVKSIKVEVGDDLMNVFKTCGSSVKIKLMSNAPILVEENTEMVSAKYMIAPII